MSMDNDTRLMMMHLRERAQQPAPARRPVPVRRPSLSATTVAAAASFALTLFTRSA